MTRATVCIAALSLLASCDHELSLGRLERADASVRTDAGPADATIADASLTPAACGVTGPLIAVGDGARTRCADAREAPAFRFGVCSCDDFVSSAELSFDAFGTPNTSDTRYAAGSLGTNAAFFPFAATLDGSLHVAGTEGIPTQGELVVGGDLLDHGQLDSRFAVSVGGDARVAGDVRVSALTVGGTLTVAQSSAVEVVAGNPPFARDDVVVEAPCDCATGPDLASLVRAAASDNDNAQIDLDAASGLKALDGPLELALPCGRYYVSELYAPNLITLTLSGHVALYVDADLVSEQGGGLRVQLTPGAELDLVIAGNISSGGVLELGTAATPRRVRVYAGGKGTLYFAGNTTLSGTLYAPTAELVSSGSFELYGATLARRVVSSGPMRVHYDRALDRVNCGL